MRSLTLARVSCRLRSQNIIERGTCSVLVDSRAAVIGEIIQVYPPMLPY
jgi:hypothetical protein